MRANDAGSAGAPRRLAQEDKHLSLLLELIKSRYGRDFTAEAQEKIRGDLVAVLERVEALRKIPLTNADEPAPSFSVEAYGVE